MTQRTDCTLRADVAAGASGSFDYRELRIDWKTHLEPLVLDHESLHEQFATNTTFGHFQRLVGACIDHASVTGLAHAEAGLSILRAVLHGVSSRTHEIGATYMSVLGRADSSDEAAKTAFLLPMIYREYFEVIADTVAHHLSGSTWLQYQAGWVLASAALNAPLYELVYKAASLDDFIGLIRNDVAYQPDDRLLCLLSHTRESGLRDSVDADFRGRLALMGVDQRGLERHGGIHSEQFWTSLGAPEAQSEAELVEGFESDPRHLLVLTWGYALQSTLSSRASVVFPTREELDREDDTAVFAAQSRLAALAGLDPKNAVFEPSRRYSVQAASDVATWSEHTWSSIEERAADWVIGTGAARDSERDLAPESADEIVSSAPGCVCFDSYLLLAPSNERWIWIRELPQGPAACIVEHSGATAVLALVRRVWLDGASAPGRDGLLRIAGRTSPPRCRMLAPLEALDSMLSMTSLNGLQTPSPALGIYGYAFRGIAELRLSNIGALTTVVYDPNSEFGAVALTPADRRFTIFKIATLPLVASLLRQLVRGGAQQHDDGEVRSDIAQLFPHMTAFWPEL